MVLCSVRLALIYPVRRLKLCACVFTFLVIKKVSPSSSSFLCSLGQQPAISGDVFRLCVDATTSPADQQLDVRRPAPRDQDVHGFYSHVVTRLFSVLQRDISGTKCDFSVQVQLRFCLSETSCPQEDHFPPNLCVKVNGKPCNLPVNNRREATLFYRCSFHSLPRPPVLLLNPFEFEYLQQKGKFSYFFFFFSFSDIKGYLPPTKNGVEPKRPSRPINITSLVRLSTTVPNTIVVSWTAEIGRVRAHCQVIEPNIGS